MPFLVPRKNARQPKTTKTAYIYTKKFALFCKPLCLLYDYNTILRFAASSYYYCYYDEIPGCEVTHGFRGNCTVFMVTRLYRFDEPNQIKNNPLKLLKYAEMLFKDLQEICDYDETISELWLSELIFKFTGWRKGTSYSVSLYDCIDSYFSK